jgi:hypothetical protein
MLSLSSTPGFVVQLGRPADAGQLGAAQQPGQLYQPRAELPREELRLRRSRGEVGRRRRRSG